VTQDEMRKAVESFKFGPPFSMLDFKVEVQHDDGAFAYVRVSAAFAERESGDVRRARFTKRLAYLRMDRPALLASLREVLRSYILHELDESIVVDGVRVFDPHAPGVAAADLAALESRLELLARPSPSATPMVTACGCPDAPATHKFGCRRTQLVLPARASADTTPAAPSEQRPRQLTPVPAGPALVTPTCVGGVHAATIGAATCLCGTKQVTYSPKPAFIEKPPDAPRPGDPTSEQGAATQVGQTTGPVQVMSGDAMALLKAAQEETPRG